MLPSHSLQVAFLNSQNTPMISVSRHAPRPSSCILLPLTMQHGRKSLRCLEEMCLFHIAHQGYRPESVPSGWSDTLLRTTADTKMVALRARPSTQEEFWAYISQAAMPSGDGIPACLTSQMPGRPLSSVPKHQVHRSESGIFQK